jgi:hypothetical protein
MLTFIEAMMKDSSDGPSTFIPSVKNLKKNLHAFPRDVVKGALNWMFRGAKKHDWRAGERGWRDENEDYEEIMRHGKCRNDR